MGVPASLESFSGVVPKCGRCYKSLSGTSRTTLRRSSTPRKVECVNEFKTEDLPRPGNRLALRISQSRREVVERQDPQPSGRMLFEARNPGMESPPSVDEEAVAEEVMRLVELLPPDIRMTLQERPDFPQVVEVVMDLGRPPFARFPSGDLRLRNDVITRDDLDYAISLVGEFGGDNRAGIDRTLHRISCLRNRDGRVVGLTCRVGRAISGSAALAADIVRAGKNILLLGRPGIGKTTVIREIARMLADECQKRVVIVDTSNEIGGDSNISHPGVGGARRMQVPMVEQQHRVMIEAVENHMPEVIIIDEIGTIAEAAAARTIAQRGVQLVATAHGRQLANLIKNPALSDLVGGICSVTLGDEEARRRTGGRKSILERAAPPTFDTAIEMLDRGCWRVHTDVALAVDRFLAEQDTEGEVRVLGADGSVAVTDEVPDAADVASSSPSTSASWDEEAAARAAAAGLPGPRMQLQSGGNLDAVRVYCYGLEEDFVWGVIQEMGLEEGLRLASGLRDSDVVLTVRSRVKDSTWLREGAREIGLPIYAVKTASSSHVMRAVRALLGIDPSAGTLFARGGDISAHAGSDPAVADGAPFMRRDLEEEARQRASAGPRPSVIPRNVAENRKDALEEARLAVEEIVLPCGQAIELLPRAPDVLQAQVELVQTYRLNHALVGEGSSSRLRIFPEQAAPTPVGASA